MNDRITTLDLSQGYVASGAERNKVLRNTYMLLAMSLLPTVLGAWLGVELGLGALLRGWMGMLLFMGVAFGFIYGIEKTKNSAAGVPMLLGFTFMLGLVAVWGIPALSRTGGEFAAVGLGEHVVGRSLVSMEGHGAQNLMGYIFTLPLYFITIFPSLSLIHI